MTGNQKIIEQSDVERDIQVGKIRPREDAFLSLKDYLGQKEKEYLERILHHFLTQKEASELLQIERTVLYRKLKKYNLKN
jgi:transcriptional regulator with PAS, ATPase and Fis domain